MKMVYEFNVVLRGKGKNVHEAWSEAVDWFAQDPGLPGEEGEDWEMVEDEDDDEDEDEDEE